MPWKKKYPGLAGAITPPEQSMAAPAPTEAAPLSSPAPSLPSQPSPVSEASVVPKIPSSSPGDNEMKKRALMNIAMGHKGF